MDFQSVGRCATAIAQTLGTIENYGFERVSLHLPFYLGEKAILPPPEAKADLMVLDHAFVKLREVGLLYVRAIWDTSRVMPKVTEEHVKDYLRRCLPRMMEIQGIKLELEFSDASDSDWFE